MIENLVLSLKDLIFPSLLVLVNVGALYFVSRKDMREGNKTRKSDRDNLKNERLGDVLPLVKAQCDERMKECRSDIHAQLEKGSSEFAEVKIRLTKIETNTEWMRKWIESGNYTGARQ